MTFLDLALG
jgi:hypothetical protein